MKKQKKAITIGIPAYNEGSNISFLIQDLLKQKQDNILVEKIIVSSDGSTDNTIEIIKSFKNKRLLLIENQGRKGLAAMENQIIKNTNSDALVLLNADIRIKNKSFLEKLVEPILSGVADLTTPNTNELKPRGFFEKTLLISAQIKNRTYEEYKNGNNVYTCYGQARALSKKLYKRIHFSSSIGNDAYSYFYCINNGFKYKYVKDISIYYRLPDNFSDHQKQSLRFFQSQELLSKKFDKKFVLSEYKIPKKAMIISFFKSFIEHPIYTNFYLFVLFYLYIKSHFAKNTKQTWDISISSKKTN